MELSYQLIGTLKPGIYDMTWEQFKDTFGYNEVRRRLLTGLEIAINELKAVGCKAVYVDGSFVTKEPIPSDFDSCWDEEGVNYGRLKALYPGLVTYGHKFKLMIKRYQGIIVPKTSFATEYETFFSYFQEDKQGREKGIVRIVLS
jgi:hypothetical protein